MTNVEKIKRQMKRIEKKFEGAGTITKKRLMKTYTSLERKLAQA